MRTVQLPVLKYDELSESAKQKALHEFNCNDSYPWFNDNKETLKAFENIFPIRVKNWEYGDRSWINFTFTGDDHIEELSGVRLATYIYNNYYSYLCKGKYYSTKGEYVGGRYTYKKRYSKIIMDNCCVLTGYHMDDIILEPIYKFLKKPCKHTNFKDLMQECLEEWVSACGKDYEHYFSEESFEEMCEANEWEFQENGAMF